MKWIRLVGLAAMAAVCATACGETERGSLRQGARKVSTQKAAPAKKQAVKRKVQKAPKGSPRAVTQQTSQNSTPVQSQFRRAPYVGAIAADADTGRVVFSDNADRRAYPASVTKLMTALLVLEDIEKGRYKLTDRATASVRATHEQPSGVGFKPGQSMTIDDLLMALMVRSANDAAVVLAENSTGGDLPAFIARMNARAAELGMSSTKYDSPNGLPPYDAKRRRKNWRTGYDYSTAADVLKLSREVVKHRQIFKYTSTKIATVTDGAGQPLRSVNHNNILVKDKQKILNAKGESEVDGLKTGYIDAGGSSISLTGSRDGHRAIVVVLGSINTKERDANARSLMIRALDAIAAKPAATPPPATAQTGGETPAADAPPAADAAQAVSDAPAADEAATAAEKSAEPGKASGGGWSTGLLLIALAGAVGTAAFFAWRWLGKGDREAWSFEDIDTEAPSAGGSSADGVG
ncbi:MAG: D-alanyl-D-alanine carboxypeptidase [Kiritimatiellae bacterium]|nr:D-alanyl-D-alanine carboxypeptidase [Kiritimatiellia bacterium]